jgi:hypothetical protein
MGMEMIQQEGLMLHKTEDNLTQEEVAEALD